MSTYSTLEAVQQPMPGVETLQLEPGMNMLEFSEFAAGLFIPEHYDLQGHLLPAQPGRVLDEPIAMSRTAEKPREPWAPDHFWHFDRAYWGENQFATVLYAQKLAGKVATTELIDTSKLLTAIEQDDPDITDVLAECNTRFSEVKYYDEILPKYGSPESIARTIRNKKASSLQEVIEQSARERPAKEFPTITTHSVSGEKCIVTDVARAVALTGIAAERGRRIIDSINKKYLDLPAAELQDRPYYHSHQWEEGQVLIFPQIGTLHRAAPSPEGEIQRDTLRAFIA